MRYTAEDATFARIGSGPAHIVLTYGYSHIRNQAALCGARVLSRWDARVLLNRPPTGLCRKCVTVENRR